MAAIKNAYLLHLFRSYVYKKLTGLTLTTTSMPTEGIRKIADSFMSIGGCDLSTVREAINKDNPTDNYLNKIIINTVGTDHYLDWMDFERKEKCPFSKELPNKGCSVLSSTESGFWNNIRSKVEIRVKEIFEENKSIIGVRDFEKISNQLAKTKFINENLEIKSVTTKHLPTIDEAPISYQLTSEQREESEKIDKLLADSKNPNDWCIAIFDEPNWKDDPLTIWYSPLRYSDIKTLRADGIKVTMFSGNAVLFSEDKKCVFIQRRSNLSDHYKYHYHTFGGAIIPFSNKVVKRDRNIVYGITREVHEETGLNLNISPNTPFIIINEFKIHFIQITCLGINVPIDLLTTEIHKQTTDEGSVLEISFDELEEKMKDYKEWTPSGWVDILYWLAMNCPNSNNQVKFNTKTGPELASELIDYLIEEEKKLS